MNEPTYTPRERASHLARMVLKELVADKPLYPVGLDELNRRLKEACDEIGFDTQTILTAVSHELCNSHPSFEKRLRQCAAGR